jgi:hypothetical protein
MILFQLVQSLPTFYALSPIDPMSCMLDFTGRVLWPPCLIVYVNGWHRGKSASMLSMFTHCFHTRAMQVNRDKQRSPDAMRKQ